MDGAASDERGLYGEAKMSQWYESSQVTGGSAKASANSMSGRGSTADATVGIRAVLPRLIELLGIVSIADLPCGDLNWVSLDVRASARCPELILLTLPWRGR